MFTLGFEKISDIIEKGTNETTNVSPNVGPGGGAPSGPEAYQPTPDSTRTGKKKTRLNTAEIAQFLMQKGASQETAHKYDSNTPDATHDEISSKIQAEKNRRKSYLKASLR